MLSPPPLRDLADGEVDLARLLRIGSGLGTRAVPAYSAWEGILRGLLLGAAIVLTLVGLGHVR